MTIALQGPINLEKLQCNYYPLSQPPEFNAEHLFPCCFPKWLHLSPSPFFLENNKMEQTYMGSAPLLTPLLCSPTRSYHYNLHYIIIRLALIKSLVCLSHRPSCVNFFSSITSGSLGMKLHRKHPLNDFTRFPSNCWDPCRIMVSMATE